MCKFEYRKSFKEKSIGTEQELIDLIWHNTRGGQKIAHLFYQGEGILAVTSDMYIGEDSTIELITTPTEINDAEGIKIRKLAIEATARILHHCSADNCSFPECEQDFVWNEMVLTKSPDNETDWNISLNNGNQLQFLLKCEIAAKVKAKGMDIPGSLRFGNQVSIGMPVSQLGSFLNKQGTATWWKRGEEAYSYPEALLDYVDEDGNVCFGKQVKIGNGSEKKELADMAYNYIISMLIFAQDMEKHPLPGQERPILEAGEKNVWSVIPRCAPGETLEALAKMSEISIDEFKSLLDKQSIRFGDLEKSDSEIRDLANHLISIPGLGHTNVSGVTVNNETAVVFEMRGNDMTYNAYLCDMVII